MRGPTSVGRVCSELLTALREYFCLNGTTVDKPLVVWEALKLFIRGTLIKIGAHLNKERTSFTDKLLTKLWDLECSHEASLARSTYQELLRDCEELLFLLYHQMKQKLAWAHHTLYEFSNKLCMLLARAICGPCTKTYISQTIGSTGQQLTASTAMAA